MGYPSSYSKNPFEKWETFHVYSRGVVTNITMHLGKFVLSTLHPIFPPCHANHFFGGKKKLFQYFITQSLAASILLLTFL